MISVKRILIPTDFSERTDAAMRYAVSLAKAVDGQLFLLHVPGANGENFEANFPFGPFEKAGKHLTGGIEGTTGIPREYAVRIGPAADEILRYARDRDIDLIVMSTHGRSGVAHLVMGSVTEKVVRDAPCPVTVVPRQAASAA